MPEGGDVRVAVAAGAAMASVFRAVRVATSLPTAAFTVCARRLLQPLRRLFARRQFVRLETSSGRIVILKRIKVGIFNC